MSELKFPGIENVFLIISIIGSSNDTDGNCVAIVYNKKYHFQLVSFSASRNLVI